MFIYFQSFFIIVLEMMCFKIFIEIFGEKRSANIWRNSFSLVLLMILAYISAFILSQNFIMRQVVFIVIYTLFIFIHLRMSFWKSFIFTMLYQGLLLVVDYIILILKNKMFDNVIEEGATFYVQSSLLVILGKIILFMAIMIIRKNLNTKSVRMLKDTEWLRYICFPVFTIFVIASMIITTADTDDIKHQEIFSVIAIGLVGINIVVFYLINDIIKRDMEIREEKIFRLQVKSQTDMYRTISENYDIQKKRTHEYKNQIMCIQSLLKKRQYDELAEYVKTISDKLSQERNYISTNHVIVDAILNAKYQEIASQNIVFVFKINDLSSINISDDDIVVILSNLLNNAQEACEKCEGKRVIKLKFVKEDDSVIISVRNNHKNKIKSIDGVIQTGKERDSDEHGIGIKNIIGTIEKYDGTYSIHYDDNEFYFSIIIPNTR